MISDFLQRTIPSWELAGPFVLAMVAGACVYLLLWQLLSWGRARCAVAGLRRKSVTGTLGRFFEHRSVHGLPLLAGAWASSALAPLPPNFGPYIHLALAWVTLGHLAHWAHTALVNLRQTMLGASARYQTLVRATCWTLYVAAAACLAGAVVYLGLHLMNWCLGRVSSWRT